MPALPLFRVRVQKKSPRRPIVVMVRFMESGGAPVYALPLRLESEVTSVRGVPLPQFSRFEVDSAAADLELQIDVEPRGALYNFIRQCVRIANLDGNRLSSPPTFLQGPARRLDEQLWYLPEPPPLPATPPQVSFIIPTRDRVDLLTRSIDTLFKKATWPNKELVVVDNGSVHSETTSFLDRLSQEPATHIVKHDAAFNYSSLINRGAAKASGEILAVLNNDVEAEHANWIDSLVRIALDPRVGVVGTKLLYPDRTIQHAGIVLGLGGLAGHPGRHRHITDLGPDNMLGFDRRVSAVTGACMVMRKSVFDSLGGFDEKFVVEFNDVDFCLRVNSMGLAVVCAAKPCLIHNEGSSRSERALRAQEITDRGQFVRTWGEALLNDRYYPSHLSLRDESMSARPTRHQ